MVIQINLNNNKHYNICILMNNTIFKLSIKMVYHIKAIYIHFSNCFNRKLHKENMFPSWYYTNMQIVTNYHHTMINFQEKKVKLHDQEDEITINFSIFTPLQTQ